MGHGRALRPRPGTDRPQLRPGGRLPARGGPVRPGVLRDQPARGGRHRPPAAAAPGDRLGGVRTGGHRPRHAARLPYRGVRRGDVRGLRRAHPPRPGRPGGVHRHRQRRVRGFRAAVVHLRAGGPGGDDRHGVLVVAGGAASRGAVPAPGRVRPGAGGRGDDHRDPGSLRRVQPAARAVPGRPVQGVRGGGGRHGLGRGRGSAPRGAAVGRPPQRPPRPRRRPGLRRQPGRYERAAVRAERPVAAAGDPPGAGGRRADHR